MTISTSGLSTLVIASVIFGFTLTACAEKSSPLTMPTPTTNSSQTTNSKIAQVIRNALGNTEALSIYRIEFESSATGGSAPPSYNYLIGTFKGTDSEFSFHGDYSVGLGLKSEQEVRVINAAQKAYVFGPVPSWDATDTRWYALSRKPLSPPLNWSIILKRLSYEKLAQTNFTSTENAILDNVSCSLYSADNAGVIRLVNVINSSEASPSEVSPSLFSFKEAYFRLWICKDGYLHQIETKVDVTDKTNQESSFGLKLHFFDMNNDIQITVPTDSIPIQP